MGSNPYSERREHYCHHLWRDGWAARAQAMQDDGDCSLDALLRTSSGAESVAAA